MIKPKNILILTLLVFFLSCGRKEALSSDEGEILYSPEYSSGFKITGEENSENTMITVYNPWQGATNVSSRLKINREGERSGDKENNGRETVLDNEARRIICMSSTHIAMLEALGAVDRIVGVSGKEYVSNPYILANSERIPDVGYEGNIDYEAIVAAKPDLVLLFSVNGASAMELKLRELGIPFLYIGDYVEEDPLGKAEWVVALSEVIGQRSKGEEIIKEIARKYEAEKQKVASLDEKKPKVMLNAPFQDNWFMPSVQSYVAKMVKDAGGDYIYKKNTGSTSMPIDTEEALSLISQADIWMNISTLKSKDEVLKNFPKFAGAECVRKGNLYNNNALTTPGGGNDCYESGVMHPDLVLRDMIKIFYPELVYEPFTYYHRLK